MRDNCTVSTKSHTYTCIQYNTRGPFPVVRKRYTCQICMGVTSFVVVFFAVTTTISLVVLLLCVFLLLWLVWRCTKFSAVKCKSAQSTFCPPWIWTMVSVNSKILEEIVLAFNVEIPNPSISYLVDKNPVHVIIPICIHDE